MQHLAGQIRFTRRLAQRQLPVEGHVVADRRLRRFGRGDPGAGRRAGLVTQQQGAQLLFINRFGQIVVHAGAQQLLFLPGHGVGRNGHDRRLLLVRKLANQLAGTNTVHLRHLNIHQDQVKLHLFRALNRLHTAFAKLNLLHLILQQDADQLQVGGVIIHGHHRHRQLILIADERHRVVVQAAILRERRQQAGGGERFQQAGRRAVVLQLLGVDLGVTRQRQQQVIGH